MVSGDGMQNKNPPGQVRRRSLGGARKKKADASWMPRTHKGIRSAASLFVW